MRKISLIWWLRIVFYIILSFLIYKGINIAGAYYLIYTNAGYLLALLIPLIIIEFFRFKIYRTYFGLYINNNTLKYIFEGFIYAIIPILFLLILSFFLDVEVNFNTELSITELSEFAFILLISAFFEELLFRGVIFQTLIQRFDHRWIIFLSAFVFSVAHYKNNFIDPFAFFNIFLAGIFFGYLLFKTLNLWICISFHFVWNFSQHFLLGSPVSGYSENNYLLNLDFDQSNKILQMIFGNEFGIESSVFVTLALLILIWYITFIRSLNVRMHKIAFKRKMIEESYKLFKTKEL